MTALLSILLNPRVLLAIAAAAVLGFAGLKLYRAGQADTQADFDAWKLAAAESRVLADRAQRTEEQRRQDIVNQEIKNAAQELDQARAADAAASAAHERVRNQLSAFLAAVRRAGQDPVPAFGSPRVSGPDPLDLLADLYSRSDEAAGAIAAYADELRIRGATCERIADRLQPPASQ